MMTNEERQAILDALKTGSTALHDAAREVSDEQAARSAGEGRWSILQCVEHVALVEEFLLSLMAQARRAEEPATNASREAMILERGADRTHSREAPAAALPRGRFATLEDALAGFSAARERTIAFLKTNEEDLLARIAVHPLMGVVNCREILALMAVHPARHAKQIEEIKAAMAG